MKRQGGFTIIEVSLYFAISGLLAGLILLGLSAMVRDQQWKGSTNSLRNLVQSQYQQVSNVINETGKNAGKSGQLLLGRYIQFTTNSSNYVTGNIIATHDVSNDIPAPSDDIAAINASALATAAPINNGKLTYGTRFIKGANVLESSSTFQTLVIVRSPVSGAVYVFTINGAPTTANLGKLSNPNKAFAIVIQQGNSGITGALCLASGSSAANITYAAPLNNDDTNATIKSRCKI